MKVLILSISTGYGHHQTALSLKNYLDSKGVSCSVLDMLEHITPLLGNGVSKGYILSTKYAPRVYGRFYRLAEKRQKSDPHLSFVNIHNILSIKLKKYIDQNKPDVIVCTHIFTAQTITYLKHRNLISCKCIGIITDFTIHPYWEDSDLDYYVTASRLLNNQLRKKGISIKKILPIGIPIHPKFGESMPKQEARNILNINPKLRTILMMTGSMGYGNIYKQLLVLDESDGDFQVLCVCGNNKRLYSRISNHAWKKPVYPYAFVDNVDIMMDASDCIVTKPGGLTMSEALAKGLPAILCNPIPGQEERNSEFLLNNGAAMKISPTFPIDEAIFHLLLHDWRFEQISSSVKMLGKPSAAKDLGEFIIDLIERKN